MAKVTRINRAADLTPIEHVDAAEELIASADGSGDAQCAQADAQIAIAHLLTAGVKIALQSTSGAKRPSYFPSIDTLFGIAR